MTYSHEIINYPDNLPMTLFINTIGTVQKHWHKSIELLIVIEGTASLIVGSDSITLDVDDVFLVNSNEIHDLHSNNATLVAIQIKPEMLKNVPGEFKSTHYTCDSTQDNDSQKYEQIKHIVARFLKLNLDGGKYIELMNESLFYNLIYELYANFSDGTLDNQDDTFKQLNRLNEVLAIINSEYMTRLSLDDIADRIFVTPPYLSKFFKQNMGITLSEHLKATRLRYAAHDLMYCDYPIDIISQNNGFPNTHAFVKAFREKYDELPSVWRTKHSKKDNIFTATDKDKSINYYENDSVTTHRSLIKFINSHIEASSIVTPVEQTANHFYTISADVEPTDVFELKRFIGVSRAKELLYEPVRTQLEEAHSRMHFDYIKMHSILEDGLFIYNETESGQPIYNFALIDQIFDFLCKIDLKPLVQLSFMPSALAANSERRMFNGNIIISEPENIDKWCNLVSRLTNHLIERYSMIVVKKWIFTVWNEPSTANEMFGFREDRIFYSLYKASYNTIKGISPDLQFGGPASFSANGKKDTWLLTFLKFSVENDCRPDFITTHFYDIDLSDEFFQKKKLKHELWLSRKEDSFSTYLDTLRDALNKAGFDNIPLYITEWNSTTSHKDYLSDTCFKSAYVVKNIIETYNKIDGICYWLLSDLHEENFLPNKLFHGDLGMYTYNGIRKPVYYALDFISKLYRNVIYSDMGIIVTKQDDSYAILLYNYHHYSDLYARDIGINTTYTDRYSVFPQKGKTIVSLCFTELSGQYYVAQAVVNRKHGSAFDNFIKMGGIERLSSSESDYLKNTSVPQLSKEILPESRNLQFTMLPFEIRLIQINPKYE